MQTESDVGSSGCLDVETTAAYVGHSLDASEVDRVDEHVAACARCRKVLSELAVLELDECDPAAIEGEHVLLRGASVGRYVIEEVLGAGAMGVVYAARDSQLKRRIALKMVRRGVTDDEALQARLLREAQALAKLSHPNVVAIYDVGLAARELFIAMELVLGVSLGAWLLDAPRAWSSVLEVFLAAGRGLAAAHAVGLVHRDFKPSNVMCGDDGRVCVTDFGLAHPATPETSPKASRHPEGAKTESVPALDGSSTAALPLAATSSAAMETSTGTILGTPAYMAPEQHRGAPADERSDQYAFCVSLFEALYQRPPFEGRSVAELAEAKAKGEVRPPPRTRVPSRVRRAVERGLRVDPAERHPSMAALISELGKDSRAQRRRTVALAVAIVTTVATVAVFVHFSRARDREQHAACAREGAAMAKIWDAARKKQGAETFARVGSSFADQAWLEVDAALARYAGHWQAARTGRCEALLARPATARTPDSADAPTTCLDDRLRDFEAVASELARVTTSPAAASAVVAAETLEPVQACDRATAARRDPGRGPGDSAQLEKVRRGLAHAKALRYFGKDAEAVAVARELSVAAEALGDPELSARLLLEASLANRSNRLIEAAERDGYRAAALADRAGDDVVRAKAWSNLLVVVGYFRADDAQSARIYDQAMATVSRAGGDPLLEADVRAAHAVVLLGQRKYAETVEEGQRAVDTYEHADAALALVDALRNQCIAEKRLGRFDDARRHCERALSVMSAAVGDRHPTVGRILSNLASVLLEHGDLAASYDAARRSIAIYDAVAGTEGPNIDVSVAGIALGEALLGLGRFPEALASFERSLGILDSARMLPNVRARALSGLGRALLELGQPERAVPLLERVLAAPDDAEPEYLAYARFALARAVAPSEAARALRLARQAKEVLEQQPTRSPLQETVRGAIEAWLLAHTPDAAR